MSPIPPDSGDCPNFDFLVRECELQAAQVGGLAGTRGGSVGATEHFRGCLKLVGCLGHLANVASQSAVFCADFQRGV